ncbi:multicopper oxidase domain-containing protein [Planotetraspora sp. GP83]|uniref:multicopper oxidase family protein n=1 Tax=Planotetraspora sp. GP83 TaxID=3156264 RepID=UPI003513089B
MATDQLMALDLLAAVVTTAAWLGAGVAAALRRPRLALSLFAAAVPASLARVGSVFALSRAGWWFAQEKVTVALPLLLVTGLVATVLAGPRLALAARRPSEPGSAESPAVVVPLLSTGYAAAAGLVVTLVFGYPATWSMALITVAIVATAVLVTWRPASVWRRTATAATTVTGLIGAGLAFLPAEATDTGGGMGHPAIRDTHGEHEGHEGLGERGGPVAVTSLRGPAAPAPGGTIRRYTLTARTATITLSSGQRVAAWTFNGQAPGPPITAAVGDLVEVRLRNADIGPGVTLHWHGYDVPSGEDGVPGLTQEATLPGREFVYRFLADRTGTYWYHTHEVSDRGVRMGLYGTLVVGPRSTGVDVTVPVHTFAGRLVFGDHDQPIDQRVAPGTPVRLRLINTDNTPHRFTLGGTPYRLVSVDGTDLNGPGELDRVGLRLPAGGRYDLSFTMPPAPAGSSAPVAVLKADDRTAAVRFTPTMESTSIAPGAARSDEDTSGWPELDLTRYGTAVANGDAMPFSAASRFDRRFTLVLDRGLALVGGRPMYAHTVNGRAFPSIPTQMVSTGDLVRMTVVNRGRETHPWHLHGHRVLVLARDGRAPSGSPLWLDTFDVRPGEVWEVAFRATNPGLWMNHCHNLSHADQGMALHLAYEGVTTPFHGTHGG